jgi:hypothetical protein
VDAGASGAVAVQVAGGAVQRLDSGGAFNAKMVAMVMSDGPMLVPMPSDAAQVSALLGGMLGQSGSGSSGNANAAEAQHRALLNQMDEIRDNLREQGTFEASTVAASAAASIGLSVGYVVWLLRGGVLLSTVLYSLPAWRSLDPLPVLERVDGDEDGDGDGDDGDDSLESMVARTNNAAEGAEGSTAPRASVPAEVSAANADNKPAPQEAQAT